MIWSLCVLFPSCTYDLSQISIHRANHHYHLGVEHEVFSRDFRIRVTWVYMQDSALRDPVPQLQRETVTQVVRARGNNELHYRLAF